MAERRMGIIAFLLCLCLCAMPCCAQAVSTADAKEAISPDRVCGLKLSYRYNGTVCPNVPVNLYKIADVSEDCQYTLDAPFAASGLILNGIRTLDEWNLIRSTLEAYILANNIEYSHASQTDQEGCARFDSLKPGLYLLAAANTPNNAFGAALISLPGLAEDGLWQYDVEVSPKGEALPPAEPDEELEYKILKLWKGDKDQAVRPKSIDVEVFKNGKSHTTFTLSEENNWSYKWSAPKDGASWTVAEKNVPEGYISTVEKKADTFVLTNTFESDDPSPGNDSPGKGDYSSSSPKTGDSLSSLIFTVLMYISGMVLILLGITGKRKRS